MSDDDLITYCGLFCDLCAERCILPRMARELLATVKDEGYDCFCEFVPGMKDHYPSFVKVLQDLSEMDCKCRDGSGGPPGCEIRICAKGKGMFVCMDCQDFPCDKWISVAKVYPFLIMDSTRYKEAGREAWLMEQKAKGAKGFCYRMVRRVEPDGHDGPTKGKESEVGT